MVVQRLLAALAWCALALAGAYLLDPSLFADIHLPGLLARFYSALQPDERRMLGLVVSGAAAAVALVVLSDWVRPRRRAAPAPRTALSFVSDTPAPAPAPAPQPPPPVAVEPPPPEAAPAATERAGLQDLVRRARQARTEGRIEDAMELSEAAVSQARDLYAAQPHGEAATDLAEALAGLAELEEAEGRLDAALAGYEESLSLHRAVAAAAPEDPQAALGLVAALSRLADGRDARGHRSRARDRYAEAVRVAERLTWLNPGANAYSEALLSARTRLEALEAEMAPEPADP